MIIIAIIFGVIAVSCYVLGAFQFCGKGFLLNNSYLYASEKERSEMDKKPYYRQSGIVFCLLGTVFAVNAAETFLQTGWLFYIVIGIVIAAVAYAIISSVVIGRNVRK